MSRSVTTPSGETWRVSRRWLPKRRLKWDAPQLPRTRRARPRRRQRGRALDWLDGFEFVDVDNPLAGLAFLVVVVVAVALLWFVLVPLLLVTVTQRLARGEIPPTDSPYFP